MTIYEAVLVILAIFSRTYIFSLKPCYTAVFWLSVIFKGGGATAGKDPLFQYSSLLFLFSFLLFFLEILGGKSLLEEGESRLGEGAPLTPCRKKPGIWQNFQNALGKNFRNACKLMNCM